MPVKVRVQGFQSLDDVSLEIDGLTVVTGTNNAGKSALFRAIHGAFVNRKGNSYVRHGAKKCRVDLEFDDGQTLCWEKGAKGVKLNDYTINGKVFKNVGQKPPEEIESLKISPILLNDDKAWPQVATQIQGVNFLLDRPGAVLAEAVADVHRVQLLNKSLKLCEKDRKKAKATLRIRRKDLEEVRRDLAKFEGVKEVVSEVKALEKRRDKALKAKEDLSSLTQIRDRYRLSKKEANKYAGFDLKTPESSESANKARTAFEEASELRLKLTVAQDAFRGLGEVEKIKAPPVDGVGAKYREALKVAKELKSRRDLLRAGFRKIDGVQNLEAPLVGDMGGRLQKALEVAKEMRKKLKASESALSLTQGVDMLQDYTVSEFPDQSFLEEVRGIRERLEKGRNLLRKSEASLKDPQEDLRKFREEIGNALDGLEECPLCGSETK